VSLRVTIELAGPPRGKGRGRAVSTQHGARVFTDDKTRKYEAQLRYAAMQEMAGRAPTIQPVRVHVEAVFQIAESWSKKKRAAALVGHVHPCTTPDADNLLKCLDSLNGVVFADDRQIVEATVRKLYGERPGLTVQVETIEPPVLPAPLTRVAGAAGDLFAVPP
jgi:Holliday junction resolvase RusA-like endonuclease